MLNTPAVLPNGLLGLTYTSRLKTLSRTTFDISLLGRLSDRSHGTPAIQHQTFLAGVFPTTVQERVDRATQEIGTQMTIQVQGGDTTWGTHGNFSSLKALCQTGANVPTGITSRGLAGDTDIIGVIAFRKAQWITLLGI